MDIFPGLIGKDILSIIDRANNSSPRKKAVIGEIMLWLFIALCVTGNVIFIALTSPQEGSVGQVVRYYYTTVTIGVLILVVPILINLIFGAFPLELIRLRNMTVEDKIKYRKDSNQITSMVGSLEFSTQPGDQSKSLGCDKKNLSSLDVLISQSETSRSLADKLFVRAGVYLFVGGVTAFSGLGFFYMQAPIPNTIVDITAITVALAPRFGVLFFIEFIAFFFLRQYRSAMDEFKYYEAIQRDREEMVFLLIAYRESGSKEDLLNAINSKQFSSKIAYLSTGQSTENIEIKRIEGSDAIGLSKIIEGIAAFKK